MSDDNLYKLSNLARIPELIEIAPEATQAFLSFEEKVYAEGHLSVKMKEAIAVAVAHVTQCPYCIDVHVEKFKKAGGTKEELLEVILVAGSVKAGGAFSHGVNALNAFDRGEKKAEAEVAAAKNENTPDCLC